jgi:hypothetical protein
VNETARRVTSALVWLALVAAIALGAAGLVSGADRPPGTAARPELTWARDQEVAAALDLASARLAELADEVAALGVQARGALAALNGTEVSTVESAIAEGDRILDQLLARTTALHLDLADVPYLARSDTRLLVADPLVARHAALVAALDGTTGLRAAWSRLTSGSLAAIQLSTLLAQHDTQVTDAAALGRAARYEDAMAALDDADATIDASRTMRNRLANTVDVTVLDEWLDRNAAYDVALRRLYDAKLKVGTRVTDREKAALREAEAAELAARANLPPDTRGLVVIMAEISRGGMSGAVIAIEEARGRLASALGPAASPSP